MSATATAISRGTNGLSSVQSTAYGAPSLSSPTSWPSTKNWTGLSTAPGGAAHARDDARGAGESGAAERRGDLDGRAAGSGARAAGRWAAGGAREDADGQVQRITGPAAGPAVRMGSLGSARGQALVFVDEVGRARGLQQRDRSEPRGSPRYWRERQRLVDEVARLAAAQRDLPRPQTCLEQVLDDRRIERRGSARGSTFLKICVNSVGRRVLGKHLVLNAAQERLVHQLGRLDVGGEHRQHQERQVELLARLQREVVDAALERHDPAVQQLARRASLAAEVVDDQHAAVGQHLQRRAVEAGTSGCRSRSSASSISSPPTVTSGRRQRTQRRSYRCSASSPVPRLGLVETLVVDRVEQLDDARRPPRSACGIADVAGSRLPDGLRDDGLAVARRAVDEQRVAGS